MFIVFALWGAVALIMAVSQGVVLYRVLNGWRCEADSSLARTLGLIVCSLALLPLRWWLGMLGASTVNYFFLMLTPLFLFSWYRVAGSLRAFVSDIILLFISFSLFAVWLSGAWYSPADLVLNHSSVVLIPAQYDLMPHYSLQNILAYGSRIGLYSSPAGYPDKLTTGSYAASMFSAVVSFNATLGAKSLWSISISRLGLFFFFYCILFAKLNIFSHVARGFFSTARSNFAIWAFGIGSFFVFYGLLLFWFGDKRAASELFVHSINNGAGLGCFLLCFAYLLLNQHHFQDCRKAFLPIGSILFSTLLFFRLNWAPFFLCFFAAAAWFFSRRDVFQVLKTWNKILNILAEVRAQGAPVKRLFNFHALALYSRGHLLVIAYSLLVAIGLLCCPLFSFPGPRLAFNRNVSEMLQSALHYYEWYPKTHLLLAGLVGTKESSLLHPLGFLVILESIQAYFVFLLALFVLRSQIFAICLFFGAAGLSASRFLVVPLNDAYHFGSTEPLGNSHIFLVCVAMSFLSLKSVEIFHIVTKFSRAFLVLFSFVLFLSLPRGETLAPLFHSFSRSPRFEKIRALCAKDVVGAVYGPNEALASVSGCIPVGEFRYSKKLSSGNDRASLIVAGRDHCLLTSSVVTVSSHPELAALCE